MENFGRILLICEDHSFPVYFKEQLLVLGEYIVVVEPTFQAATLSLGKRICDLVFVKYATAQTGIDSLILELKKVDPDCTVVVLLNAQTDGLVNEFAELGVFESMIWPVNADKLKFIIDN